jgi:hypothetical protein
MATEHIVDFDVERMIEKLRGAEKAEKRAQLLSLRGEAASRALEALQAVSSTVYVVGKDSVTDFGLL